MKIQPREVRIIGGQWRRSRLPVSDQPGLRPTPDRVRETLFNWLGQDMTGWHCLDAFAGTGALGLEAASRGAAEVILVEQDVALVASLRQTLQRLKATTVKLQRGDGLTALRTPSTAAWDIVFLDPPFCATHLASQALATASQAVRDGAWVYLEAPAQVQADVLASLRLTQYRYLKAGAVHVHLLRKLRL